MLKIGDFSKLTHVSVRMLRYYDNQGLLKPHYIDPITNYRMYSAEQVPELQKIILLRDLNFGVADIHEILNHWNEEHLILRLQDKVSDIKKIIESENNRIQQIHTAITHIKEHKIDQYYNVTLKSVPSYPVISLRQKVNSHFDEGNLWQELMNYVHQEHLDYDKSSQNNVAIYHDEEHLDSQVDIEVCIIVKRLGKSTEKFTYRMLESVEKMACVMVYGPYENIAGAYQAFVEWLDKNQPYTLGNTSRQVTIIAQHITNNPADF